MLPNAAVPSSTLLVATTHEHARSTDPVVKRLVFERPNAEPGAGTFMRTSLPRADRASAASLGREVEARLNADAQRPAVQLLVVRTASASGGERFWRLEWFCFGCRLVVPLPIG